MSGKKVQILYKDNCGVYAPLSHLYFSSSSKILIARYVDNVTEEILSSFCPQCFTRYFESDAVMKTSGGMVCATCSNCPLCQGVMVKIAPDDPRLQCSNCQWDFAPLEGEEDNTASTAKLYFDHLDKFFNRSAAVSSKEGAVIESPESGRRWQLSDLERKLASAENHKSDDAYSLWYKDNAPEKAEKSAQQQLLPVPTRLVNKRTLRCQQDLDNNRMNLLVLPKTMPLEGDSSQVINKGKWFDKNAAACFTLPILTILHLPTVTNPHLICKLANHTDKKLNCVFYTAGNELNAASTYMRQDAETGAFEYVASLPVVYQFMRPQHLAGDTGPTNITPTTTSVDAANAMMNVFLEEYEDELLKEDFVPRDRSRYYPPIPAMSEDEGKGENPAWKVVVQSNVAYLYIPMPSNQLCEASTYEIHLAWDVCVHGAAGKFTLPLDLKVRVE
eukprot:gene29127-35155_t